MYIMLDKKYSGARPRKILFSPNGSQFWYLILSDLFLRGGQLISMKRRHLTTLTRSLIEVREIIIAELRFYMDFTFSGAVQSWVREHAQYQRWSALLENWWALISYYQQFSALRISE